MLKKNTVNGNLKDKNFSLVASHIENVIQKGEVKQDG